MPNRPYGLICPISHACEILEPRWTIPILTEMWGGATRFNDIRRGVGNISTALLSRRLKELVDLRLVERIEDPATGQIDYVRTQRAVELEPVLDAMARWAQCNIRAKEALGNLTVSNLMWQMRGYIDTGLLPQRQLVFEFHFSDPDLEYSRYWALIRPGCPVEICVSIPSYEVDLYIETSKISLSSIIINRSTIDRELAEGRLFLSGDATLSRTMSRWFYRYKKVDPAITLQLEDSPQADRRRFKVAASR